MMQDGCEYALQNTSEFSQVTRHSIGRNLANENIPDIKYPFRISRDTELPLKCT